MSELFLMCHGAFATTSYCTSSSDLSNAVYCTSRIANRSLSPAVLHTRCPNQTRKYNRRDPQMFARSMTSRSDQCLCMANYTDLVCLRLVCTSKACSGRRAPQHVMLDRRASRLYLIRITSISRVNYARERLI
jgi:hypothetical protein